jgi:hypothetical protein
MEMQNIALALPKQVLRKVQLITVQRDTSVSALLSTMLEELVSQCDAYQQARQRQLALMETGLVMGSGEEPCWTREQLHERRGQPRPSGIRRHEHRDLRLRSYPRPEA